MNTSKNISLAALLTCFILALAACASSGNKTTAKQECTRLMQQAEKRYEAAKAESIADAGLFTKVSAIMTNGSVAKEFGGYDRCIRKARRALELLQPYQNQQKKNK